MQISIGSDHRGVHIKAKLIANLEACGHQVRDFGTDGETSVDYPDFASLVCKSVAEGASERGILICGTGIGMAIAANKFSGVRAANCYDEVMAELCRRHNNVNVLCLPGDLIGDRPMHDLVGIWIGTEFEGGRHQRRLEKIEGIEHTQRGLGDEG
ncbi:ribose 5-phosphate isomerase B [Aureliella helgolandensis]|uniref:Ribose-5-phosphate isomerase B n=1 Tax=Aureliella helgolandensis TaxID=2527968 RepID=A0A518GAV7_9BACT|nr:ribose 5-phosphate isomerase B [Aureliella helgolandensis]QDV25687.1 Ribose-5-phosphate isomerase B [Aureliella helgolandensis]